MGEYCDRCKEVIIRSEGGDWLFIETHSGFSSDEKYLLCKSCWYTIKPFISDKRFTNKDGNNKDSTI